jgi:hypothetical protein
MNTKTKIKDVNQLVGLFLDTDKDSINVDKLTKIATSLGFNTVQIRDSSSFYDCMYDPTRLQIHISDNKQIESVQRG